MTNEDIEITTAEYPKNEEQEQILWRRDITKGWIRKKVVHSDLITNNHVCSGSQILNLDDIDSAVTLNQQTFYEGTHQSTSVHGGNMGVRQGRSRGKGTVYGDVIFNSSNNPDLIFAGVIDPKGIVDLVKSLKKAKEARIER